MAGSLQITADCWALLSAFDGSSRKEHDLPKGEREPDTAYRKRRDAARPSGLFRDALRTYAGMLSRGSWSHLPASLSSVLSDVDGRGTDLGVFLAAADLLVLRDGAALVLVLPPEHSWPSEGDRQQAQSRGDRLSLPRLQLVLRANVLNWELPSVHGLPQHIAWREPLLGQAHGAPPDPAGGAAPAVPLPPPGNAPRGGTSSGLQRAHHPVAADPQAASGWRATRRRSPLTRASSACRPAGTPPMAPPSGRATYPTWVWRTRSSTTSAARASTRNC